MTLDNLKALSKTGEGQYLEFKQNINNPNQIVEEVVGFANSEGGSLFIGIDDNGELTGLKHSDDDAAFMIDYLVAHIHPKPCFESEIIKINSKRSVIHLKIKSGNVKPYGVINKTTSIAKVFFRVEDQCLQASREMKNILKGITFSQGQVIKYTDLEDEVLKLIERNQPVTKDFLQKKSRFTSRKISDCLVRLVLAGVIKITPTTENDLYEFNNQI